MVEIMNKFIEETPCQPKTSIYQFVTMEDNQWSTNKNISMPSSVATYIILLLIFIALA